MQMAQFDVKIAKSILLHFHLICLRILTKELCRMELEMILSFLTASVVLSIMPGPDNIFVLTECKQRTAHRPGHFPGIIAWRFGAYLGSRFGFVHYHTAIGPGFFCN